jgi:predicted aspartyl protease
MMLSIDYERRTVSFQLGNPADGDVSLSGYHTVPLIVQGFTLRVLLDTGFQGILLYNARLREGLPRVRTEREPATITMMGRIRGVQVQLPGVRIGGSEETATVWLIDADRNPPPGIDGYLGPASLHAKQIEFDFAANVLHWQ